MQTRSYARRRSQRRGFTLLEIILAVSMAVVLFMGLYAALYVQFNYGRVAREIIEESNVVRSILNRITDDISPIQGPLNPFLYTSGAYSNTATSATGTAASSTAASSSATGTASTASTTGSSSSASTSSSATGSSASATNIIDVTVTNIGVKGQNDSVVFTVSKIDREMSQYIGDGSTPPKPMCDIRRISYYFVEGKGLMRKVDTDVTSSDKKPPVQLPPEDNGEGEVISSEVTELKIQYFGSLSLGTAGWLDDWDGSTAQYPGNTNTAPFQPTQTGPPAAIKFTMTLKLPPASRGGTGRTITVTHVVAIPSANNFVTPTTGASTP